MAKIMIPIKDAAPLLKKGVRAIRASINAGRLVGDLTVTGGMVEVDESLVTKVVEPSKKSKARATSDDEVVIAVNEVKIKAAALNIADLESIPSLRVGLETAIRVNEESTAKLDKETLAAEQAKDASTSKYNDNLAIAKKLKADISIIKSFTVNKSAYVVKLVETVLRRATLRPVERIIKIKGYQPWDICGDGQCPMPEKCVLCAKELQVALVAVGLKLKYDEYGVYIPSVFADRESRGLDDSEYLTKLLEVLTLNKKTKELK